MEDKISVIVPIYNVENYLRKCIESLINQTYKNIEIVLVDDGSLDGCDKICNEYAVAYSNIVVFHKVNGGLSDARNYGVKKASADLIAFVDSDDFVEVNYIDTLVKLKVQFNAEMVVTRTVRENEDGKQTTNRQSFDDFLANKKEALFEIYAGGKVGWSAYGKLIPKYALLKHPFPEGYYEDCACMYKIIEEFDRIAIGNYESNYHYVQRSGSILCSPLNDKHLHIFDIANEFKDFIENMHPDMEILIVWLYKSAVLQLLNLQSMPWETYKCIFMKYRALFRKSLIRVLRDEKIDRRLKVYHLLLCGWPGIFYFQRKIVIKMQVLGIGKNDE